MGKQRINPFPRKKAPLPVVLVRWLDANSDTDDFNVKDPHTYTPVVTAGFLVRKDKHGVTLSTDIFLPVGDEKECTPKCRHHIPHGMIQDITVLRK